MKTIHRVFCVLLAVALAAALGGAAFAEDGYTDRYIEALGMNVSVPDDVRILTQDMEDGDPSVVGLGMTASYVSYLLSTQNEFLEVFRDEEDWIVALVALERDERELFAEDTEDLSLYDEAFLRQIEDELITEDPDTPVELVYLDGHPFFRADMEEDGYLLRAYISVVGAYEVWFNFSTAVEALDGVEPLWDDILARVTFGAAPAAEEAEPTEAAAEEPAPEEPEESVEVVPVTYTLTADEFTIELPSDLYVLRIGMEEDDPALGALGMTREAVESQLAGYGNCLDVIPASFSWELVAATQTSEDFREMGDAALFSQKDFDKLFSGYIEGVAEGVAEELGIDPDTITISDGGLVRLGDYLFYRAVMSYELDASIYNTTTQYITVYGGRMYSFSFNGSGLSRAEQEAILSTVRLTAEPTGITELKTGLPFDIGRVPLYALAGAVIGGIVGAFAAFSKRKKTKGAHAAGRHAAPVPSKDYASAPRYSVPGSAYDDISDEDIS